MGNLRGEPRALGAKLHASIVSGRRWNMRSRFVVSYPSAKNAEGWGTGASHAAEKPDPEGGGGFNFRIKSAESMRALVPEAVRAPH